MVLQEVLKVCEDFISNSEDKNVLETYNDMLKNLVIRSYLPMQEKVIALVRMIIDSDKDIDVPATFFTAGLEIACCFDGLLSYTNIETDVNVEIKNYENYDLIYQSGLADYILQYCEKDYDRLVRMMERTLSYENLTELVESMREVNFGKLSEVTTAIKNIKSEIDPEVIKNMADIMRLNDPNLTKLNDTLSSDAADKAVEKHYSYDAKARLVMRNANGDYPVNAYTDSDNFDGASIIASATATIGEEST